MLQQHVSHVHSRHHEQRRGHHMSTIGVCIYTKKKSYLQTMCCCFVFREFVAKLQNRN